ncbi:MAG TPA: hypothetical protein VJT09_10550 [Pyrinomonadaceae bacterium]|nr:hypothetical protein [Pyrinomonadaceae bacterium]
MRLAFTQARGQEIENPSQGRARRVRFILLASVTVWLFAVGYGLSVLWGYENAPGALARPPVQWPIDSRIQPAPDGFTLVMLAHPHCPCTRASVNELAMLMAHSQGRLRAYVLFLKPAGFSEDWEKTDLWQSAASIPGVKAIVDVEGAEARRFNAATSGQTVLYNAQGQLVFNGGITGSRGHSGDNAGRSAIESLVNAGKAERAETFVFGCPLFDKDSECRELIDERQKH